MNALRLSLVAAVALTLTACGGAKLGGGKEGAAKAVFQASGPTSQANKGAQALRLMHNGLTTGEVKVDGQKSGTATLAFTTDSTNTTGDLAFTVKYDNFSDDGKNYYSGSMTMTMKLNFNIGNTGASGNMQLTMKGKIDISGEISDFVDADVTETVDFAKLSETSGSVTVTLNGTIATSTESYTYNNEAISITAEGGLPADDGSKA